MELSLLLLKLKSSIVEISKINMEPRTIVFKSAYWSAEETEDNKLIIHVGGRTADNKSVHCIVTGFTPYVYLELPQRINWNKAKCIALFEYFKKTMKDEGPLEYWPLKKYKLHHKKEVNVLCMTFPTNKAAHLLAAKCMKFRNGLIIDGLGTFRQNEFIVHEQNVDPILKFTASKKIKLASWITVTETIFEEDEGLDVENRKFSTADIDLKADWGDVDPCDAPEGVVINPTFVSFDIECNSKNHNSKIPDPTIPENYIFSIANTCGTLNAPKNERKKVLFSLGNPLDIEGVEIVRCESEKDLLLRWRDFIVEEDPDIFIGYNIMKFDWNYMIHRAELNGIYLKFAQISRVIGKRASIIKSSWSSSAYGEQEFRYLDPAGRTNVDVILEIERNYKLPKYSLDYVSEYFLKENKEDISARQLFILVQLVEEMTEKVNELKMGIVEKEKRIELKRNIQRILPLRWCSGVVKDLRNDLMLATKGSEFKNLVRKAFTLTGIYNVKDTELPVDLVEKLNLRTTMEEMSNCMNVPMSYLHTRGQQIKVLAQIYRETIFNDIIIPYKDKSITKEDKYQGAMVIEAHKGDYDNVVSFDFESLYPSVIIAYNICYTTYIEDGDPIPDEECNVLTWEDHSGCEHDPKHRKKKDEDILCRSCRYRFRKVVTLPDGTRLYEGLMSKLERSLLSERKQVKKEMAKMQAKYDMATGIATPDQIENYRSKGWEIIEKGSIPKKKLDVLKVTITVLNAKQLALKVSANSAYGSMGSPLGYIPLIPGAASVCAMGRQLITEAIKFVSMRYPDTAKVVYGDTDSAMITFIGKNTEESFILGDRISKETSYYLKMHLLDLDENYEIFCPSENKTYKIYEYPRNKMNELEDEDKINIHRYDANPVNLQFDNMYKRYLLLTMKRYMAYSVNRKGELISVVKKGIVLTRRDNCQYLKDAYKQIMSKIMDNKSEEESMYALYDQIHKLFTRQIPDANLIIYMGVKTIMNYAKKIEVKRGREVVDKFFVDEYGDPVVDPIGPLDPRLVYTNIPQVLLSLKMLRRGDDVPPNTRLEFIYLENDDADHQGEKAEDYTYYKENKSSLNLKPDYLHYIEKQLTKPIMELLDVKYPKTNIVPYEKMEEAFERCVNELEPIYRYRVEQIKQYSKTVSSRTYNFTKTEAKIEFILDSMKKKRENPKVLNEINPAKYKELEKVCRSWKSINILNNFLSKHNQKKKVLKKPKQTSEKLRIKVGNENVKVVLMSKQGKYGKGTIAELVGYTQTEFKEHVYDLKFEDGNVIKKVPRKAITTFYYKDSTIMKDILLARYYFKQVIFEMNDLFGNVRFVNKKMSKIIEESDED